MESLGTVVVVVLRFFRDQGLGLTKFPVDLELVELLHARLQCLFRLGGCR